MRSQFVGFTLALLAAVLLPGAAAYARGGGGHGGGHGGHGGGHEHHGGEHHGGEHHGFAHHHFPDHHVNHDGHHWDGHNGHRYPYGWAAAGMWGLGGYAYDNPAYVYPAGTNDTQNSGTTYNDVGSPNAVTSETIVNDTINNPSDTAANAPAQGANYTPTPDQLADAQELTEQGEAEFRDRDYERAARDWRHALLDNPNDGAVVMLLGQALFANGQYSEAAGAIQGAMRMLPQDQWGNLITNYREIYGNATDYNDQLRALEKARDAKPDAPSLRFLLGFHYAYLGYPQQAVRELDKTLALAPKDEMARQLRDLTSAKLSQPANAQAAVGP